MPAALEMNKELVDAAILETANVIEEAKLKDAAEQEDALGELLQTTCDNFDRKDDARIDVLCGAI